MTYWLIFGRELEGMRHIVGVDFDSGLFGKSPGWMSLPSLTVRGRRQVFLFHPSL